MGGNEERSLFGVFRVLRRCVSVKMGSQTQKFYNKNRRIWGNSLGASQIRNTYNGSSRDRTRLIPGTLFLTKISTIEVEIGTSQGNLEPISFEVGSCECINRAEETLGNGEPRVFSPGRDVGGIRMNEQTSGVATFPIIEHSIERHSSLRNILDGEQRNSIHAQRDHKDWIGELLPSGFEMS